MQRISLVRAANRQSSWGKSGPKNWRKSERFETHMMEFRTSLYLELGLSFEMKSRSSLWLLTRRFVTIVRGSENWFKWNPFHVTKNSGTHFPAKRLFIVWKSEIGKSCDAFFFFPPLLSNRVMQRRCSSFSPEPFSGKFASFARKVQSLKNADLKNERFSRVDKKRKVFKAFITCLRWKIFPFF